MVTIWATRRITCSCSFEWLASTVGGGIGSHQVFEQLYLEWGRYWNEAFGGMLLDNVIWEQHFEVPSLIAQGWETSPNGRNFWLWVEHRLGSYIKGTKSKLQLNILVEPDWSLSLMQPFFSVDEVCLVITQLYNENVEEFTIWVGTSSNCCYLNCLLYNYQKGLGGMQTSEVIQPHAKEEIWSLKEFVFSLPHRHPPLCTQTTPMSKPSRLFLVSNGFWCIAFNR